MTIAIIKPAKTPAYRRFFPAEKPKGTSWKTTISNVDVQINAIRKKMGLDPKPVFWRPRWKAGEQKKKEFQNLVLRHTLFNVNNKKK